MTDTKASPTLRLMSEQEEYEWLVDQINAMLSQGKDRSYLEWWKRHTARSLHDWLEGFTALDLEGARRLYDVMRPLDVELKSSIEKYASMKPVRQPRSPGPQAYIAPTWQDKHAAIKTGKANPQGPPAGKAGRGNAVAGAGQGTKEKARRK